MRKLQPLLLAVALFGLVSPARAQLLTSCSAAEEKSLAAGSIYINTQLEQLRHRLTYISPEQLDELNRRAPQLVDQIRNGVRLTAADEDDFRKKAAEVLCKTLNRADRERLEAFYKAPGNRELVGQQLQLYRETLGNQAKVFQANLIKATLSVRQ